jgi:hypothetical protein
MPSSESLWVVLSNLLLLAAISMLHYRKLLVHYWVEATGIVVAIWQSCVFHACYAGDIRWCPAETPQVLHGWDVMAAQLVLVWIVTPFIEQFVGPRWRVLYASTATVVTHLFVTMFVDDNIATSATLSAIAAIVLVGITVKYVPPEVRTLGWRARFVATMLVAIFAVVAYWLEDGGWHARWHAAGAAALFLSYSLLLPVDDKRLKAAYTELSVMA